MKALRKFNFLMRKILLLWGTLLLSAFVAVVFLQVISRNILRVSMDWTSEVALLTFVWSVMSGSAVALSMRRHYMVDLIPVRHVKLNKGVLILSDLLVMAFILSLIWGGARFAFLGWYRLTTALEIPRFWLFVSLPISAFFMLTFNVENLLIDIKDFRAPQEKGGETP